MYFKKFYLYALKEKIYLANWSTGGKKRGMWILQRPLAGGKSIVLSRGFSSIKFFCWKYSKLRKMLRGSWYFECIFRVETFVIFWKKFQNTASYSKIYNLLSFPKISFEENNFILVTSWQPSSMKFLYYWIIQFVSAGAIMSIIQIGIFGRFQYFSLNSRKSILHSSSTKSWVAVNLIWLSLRGSYSWILSCKLILAIVEFSNTGTRMRYVGCADRTLN